MIRLWISLLEQSLELRDEEGLIGRRYSVSTARNGAGEQRGSYRTPRGRHVIRARIGAGAPENTVFVRRRPTGEMWTPELAGAFPGRDWILTRILWLSGTERGFNRLGVVDTMRRYIYLHGSPDSVPMGVPGSIGCVRMRNRDIVELFDRVEVGSRVDIVEYGIEAGDWSSLGAEAGVIRESVFVKEQGVPAEMEYDEWDAASLHVVARGPGKEAIGTGRLLPDGHIGRMAVAPSWRGKGVGAALLARLLEAGGRRGLKHAVLHAQLSAAGFYRACGFVAASEPFMEAGIPHVAMRREFPT